MVQVETGSLEPLPVAPKAFLKELRTASSVARLLTTPRKRFVRKAQKQPVLTLPGFGSGDAAMLGVRQQLKRAGFDTYRWQLGFNLGDVPNMLPRVVERIETVYRRTQQPVRLVGWSLGGFLAREAAREVPELVAHIVTLASPIRGGPKYTITANWYRRQGVDVDAIEAAVAERANHPLPVPVSCVYSKADGVVDWRAVVDFDNPKAANFEVDCSHLAMGIDPRVLAIVTDELLASLTTSGS